mmetsp:Transcript_19681/g.45715  ORF Transcript_19681/g.45715 Transcript_19681/m.45715 type:complete len:336 (+) Transcript_19681:716-1723(+)
MRCSNSIFPLAWTKPYLSAAMSLVNETSNVTHPSHCSASGDASAAAEAGFAVALEAGPGDAAVEAGLGDAAVEASTALSEPLTSVKTVRCPARNSALGDAGNGSFSSVSGGAGRSFALRDLAGSVKFNRMGRIFSTVSASSKLATACPFALLKHMPARTFPFERKLTLPPSLTLDTPTPPPGIGTRPMPKGPSCTSTSTSNAWSPWSCSAALASGDDEGLELSGVEFGLDGGRVASMAFRDVPPATTASAGRWQNVSCTGRAWDFNASTTTSMDATDCPHILKSSMPAMTFPCEARSTLPPERTLDTPTPPSGRGTTPIPSGPLRITSTSTGTGA